MSETREDMFYLNLILLHARCQKQGMLFDLDIFLHRIHLVGNFHAPTAQRSKIKGQGYSGYTNLFFGTPPPSKNIVIPAANLGKRSAGIFFRHNKKQEGFFVDLSPEGFLNFGRVGQKPLRSKIVQIDRIKSVNKLELLNQLLDPPSCLMT